MSDLSPVELIAETLREHQPEPGIGCTCGFCAWSEDHQAHYLAASVRSWPATTQAQLIGGTE